MKEKQSKSTASAKSSLKHRRVLNAQFFFSVISLFIVMAVFITSSTAWFTIKTSQLNASRFELECGKGLRVNDSGTSEFNLTKVAKYITPASSVNGRNLFFPADGTDFSSKTETLTYRSATVGDKNENYIQIDFKLTAQENNTAIYINTDHTSMSVTRGETTSTTLAAPLRMAIWSDTVDDEGMPTQPVIFNPTGTTYTTAAVESIDRSSGTLNNLGRQVSHAFSDYAYGGDPIATLKKGVETKFSILIWLEGADRKCTWDRMQSQDINLEIAFTTSWDKTQVIRFKDATGSNDATGWVKEKIAAGYGLTLHYENSGDVTEFNMYPYNHTGNDLTGVSEWSCNMPGDMKQDISFILTPPAGSTDKYIFCKNWNDNGATTTYDRGVNKQYVAKETSAPTTDANRAICKGYWVPIGDSEGGGSDIGDIDGDDF